MRPERHICIGSVCSVCDIEPWRDVVATAAPWRCEKAIDILDEDVYGTYTVTFGNSPVLEKDLRTMLLSMCVNMHVKQMMVIVNENII